MYAKLLGEEKINLFTSNSKRNRPSLLNWQRQIKKANYKEIKRTLSASYRLQHTQNK